MCVCVSLAALFVAQPLMLTIEKMLFKIKMIICRHVNSKSATDPGSSCGGCPPFHEVESLTSRFGKIYQNPYGISKYIISQGQWNYKLYILFSFPQLPVNCTHIRPESRRPKNGFSCMNRDQQLMTHSAQCLQRCEKNGQVRGEFRSRGRAVLMLH